MGGTRWVRGAFGPIGFLAAWLCATQPAQAVMVGVFEASAYLNWAENPGAQTLYELGIADPFLIPPRATTNEFAGAGFGTTFASVLVDGIGEISWVISNDTGAQVNNVVFFAYVNLDILDPFLDPFNESASFQGTGLPPGAPAGAIGFSAWEADDGDPFFGDLRANLDLGSLDDTNAIPAVGGPDVAFALAFAVGSLGVGEQFEARLFVTDGIAAKGLAQSDLDSAESVSFNGYARKVAPQIAVPEPATAWLMLLGLFGLGVMVRGRKNITNS